MTVSIDVDGVLRDFTGKTEEVYKKHYTNHQVITRDVYDFSKWFPIGKKIYKFAFEDHVKEIMLEADAYPKASNFMRYLKNKGHKVIIVSSQPNENCEKYTIKWLQKNNIKHDEIHFTSNKEDINFDVHLDDSTEKLQKIQASGKIAVCFDRSWNKDWDGHRVHSYEEFIELLSKL